MPTCACWNSTLSHLVELLKYGICMSAAAVGRRLGSGCKHASKTSTKAAGSFLNRLRNGSSSPEAGILMVEYLQQPTQQF